MRSFYVTKRQVDEFIRSKVYCMNQDEFIIALETVLADLKEFPNDNPAQIKFYTRVWERLVGLDNSLYIYI